MHFTTLFAIAMASAPGWASYVLEDDYMSGGNFFDKFSFWDSADPTNGFVSYQAQSDAQSQGLISSSPNNIRMGVNSQDITPNGRQSVRITSTKSYQSGLVILDLDHMPGGICGTWPAFWMVGPDWPSQGEIDIIEGVNDQASNAMTLHTGPDCSISSSTNDSTNSLFSGSIKTNNCDVNAQGQDKNAGCGITTTDTRTYGTGFNQNGGGVYATEWTGSSISVYFFPRGSVPSDIDSGSPDPSTWGTPVAKFEGGCDFSTKFTNQQIVFDTTFCGDWAGATWSGSSCSSKADTCNNFVANNPSAFQDAYWSVNGLKVYSNNGGSGSPSATAETAPPSSVPASHGQPTASAWGAPSAAPPSSAPASQGQSSKSAWGTPAAAPSGPAQSSFVTVSSGAPAPSSGGGWAPVVTSSGAIVSARIPGPTSATPAPSSAPAAPSSAPAAPSPSSPAEPSQGGWPQGSHTGESQPWQSGSWQEHETGHGAYAVGVPVHQGRRHRHLRQHKAHKAGRL